MPGAANWSGVAEHHHGLGVHVEVWVVGALREVADIVENDRCALVLEQSRVGGGDLHHRAVGA
jgi:hypothetical protein